MNERWDRNWTAPITVFALAAVGVGTGYILFTSALPFALVGLLGGIWIACFGSTNASKVKKEKWSK